MTPEFLLTTLIVMRRRAQPVISRPRIVAWMRRSFAATYVILAGRLAAQTR